MKFRLATLSALLSCVLFTPALLAQEEEGGNRGGRQGRQGGMRGMGMGMGMGMMGGGRSGRGAMELIGLLRMEEVRADIKMTDADYDILQNSQAEMMNEMRGMRDMSEEERTAKMKEIGEKANELFDEVLQSEQQKRLMGLLVQQSGHAAALNDLIAKEIGLSEEDKEKLKTTAEEALEQMRSEMQGGGEGGRPDFTALRAKMQTTMNEAVDSVLSDEQEAVLDALKGEAFKFPEPQFGGRGGRGQGGPGGGGPGGEGRGQGGPGGERGRGGEQN